MPNCRSSMSLFYMQHIVPNRPEAKPISFPNCALRLPLHTRASLANSTHRRYRVPYCILTWLRANRTAKRTPIAISAPKPRRRQLALLESQNFHRQNSCRGTRRQQRGRHADRQRRSRNPHGVESVRVKRNVRDRVHFRDSAGSAASGSQSTRTHSRTAIPPLFPPRSPRVPAG